MPRLPLLTDCATAKAPILLAPRPTEAELLQTPYAKIERSIRDQLGRMLGGTGFDPARDITAITVNRWAIRPVER